MKLLDVCHLIVDCPHTTAKDEGEGYALIRTPNIGPGYFILDNVHRVSKEVYESRIARAIPQPEDLILAREAPVGNVAIIPSGEKFCLGQRTVLIRPNKELVNPLYLNYFLNSPKVRHDLISGANGATVAHLNMPTIRGLEICLPLRPVQDNIASILSAYDDMIANCKRQIALLEEAAQRLYREWFVDMRFPGHETAPFSENGLPEGWKCGMIADIGHFKRGKNLLTKDARNGKIAVIAGGLTPSCYHDECNTGFPVITVSGSGANAGFTALHGTPVWASDCSFLDNNSTEHVYFIYCFLKNNVNLLFSKQKGSAQPHVYARDINELDILVPSIELLTKFTKIVTPYYLAIDNHKHSIAQLTHARDILLPRLISGEIETKP